MSQPSAKTFEKKLDKVVELVKQRVRIGEIIYSSKKDAERWDTRNWLREGEEELADLIAYAVFCHIQLESIYRILRRSENKLIAEVKEIRHAEIHNNSG